MRIETQIELFERAARHLRDGTTDESPYNLRVPAAHYVDDAQAAREVDVLFRRRPLLVALSPDLPAPGAYLTHETGEMGLLLVRDDDGRVRAYLNACRHRGARLAEGRGSTKVFSCPFHAWIWRRDGRLAGRPNSNGGFEAVDPLCDRLWERPCLEIAGLVFVLLEGDDIDLPDNAVDRVFCKNVPEYVPDCARTLAEHFRLVRIAVDNRGEKHRQPVCAKCIKQFPVGGHNVRAFRTERTGRIGKTIDHVDHDQCRTQAQTRRVPFEVHFRPLPVDTGRFGGGKMGLLQASRADFLDGSAEIEHGRFTPLHCYLPAQGICGTGIHTAVVIDDNTIATCAIHTDQSPFDVPADLFRVPGAGIAPATAAPGVEVQQVTLDNVDTLTFGRQPFFGTIGTHQ